MAENPDTSELIAEVTETAKAEGVLGEKPKETGEGVKTEGEQEIPEFMKDMDLSGLTPEGRQKVIEKGKQLYTGFQKKTTKLSEREREVAELKAMKEELDSDPELKEVMQKAYHAKKAGIKVAKSEKSTDDVKELFDQWEEQTTDPQAKESIRQLSKAVEQKIQKVGASKKELEDIKLKLNALSKNTAVSRQGEVTAQLDTVSEAFKPLVEKYKPNLIKLGVTNPNLSLRRLLQVVSTEDEYDNAVFQDKQKLQHKEITKKKEVATFKSSGATGTEGIGTDAQIPSKSNLYGKKWNVGKLLDKVFPDVRKEMPS